MRVRFFSLLLALLTIPTLAFADFHKADFYGGGSGGTGGSAVGGVLGSINWGTQIRWFDAVLADVSWQHGSHEGKALNQVAIQAGGRFFMTSFNKVDKPYKPFLHVLIGGVHTGQESKPWLHDMSITVGGGYEHFWKKEGDHYKGLGVRGQVDLVMRPGDSAKFWRYSGGIVYRDLPHPH